MVKEVSQSMFKKLATVAVVEEVFHKRQHVVLVEEAEKSADKKHKPVAVAGERVH